MNRQMNQEEEGKENKIRTRVKDDAWGVQDEWEDEAQTKDKNIFKKMLQSIKYTWNAKDDATRCRPMAWQGHKNMLYVLKGLKRLN